MEEESWYNIRLVFVLITDDRRAISSVYTLPARPGISEIGRDGLLSLSTGNLVISIFCGTQADSLKNEVDLLDP